MEGSSRSGLGVCRFELVAGRGQVALWITPSKPPSGSLAV
jgi:hypothetical protein